MILLVLFSATVTLVSTQQASKLRIVISNIIIRVGIIIPPKSMSIVVNRTATFTCTAVAGEIEWQINGQPGDDEDNRHRGFNDELIPLTTLNATQNLRTRTLSAFGSKDNNGSNITCIAYFLSPPFSTVISEPVVLLVFELGMIPGDYTYTFYLFLSQIHQNQSVTSLWSPSTPLLSSSPGVLPSLWRGYPSWATMSPSPTPPVERMRQCQ